MEETTAEEKTLKAAGLTWNEFLQVECIDENDKAVVCECIHRIQDMMYTRLYIKKHGKL